MKYLVLLLLLCVLCWIAYQQFTRKLRSLRGEPEPVHKAPQSVKRLAAAIVVVYGVWVIFRLYTNG